jgi:hypothetical protein
LTQRDWMMHVTVLSGDIGVPNNSTDNTYHVFYNSGLNSTAVLDGFTITGGKANVGGYPANAGAGMFNDGASPSLVNCIFANNAAGGDGGGMLNLNSSAAITNCVFSGNSAGGNGGGIYNEFSSGVSQMNCTFSGNSAAYNGGGVANGGASPVLTNCLFTGNTCNNGGGGLYNSVSSPTLRNCTFSANSATFNSQGILSEFSSNPNLSNCILWGSNTEIGGNATVTYSIVQQSSGVFPGTGNLNIDPLFVSGTDRHLQDCSPAIDAGTATGAPSTDRDGNVRPANAGYDMGAFEFQGTLPTTITCYADTDGDGFGQRAGFLYHLRGGICEQRRRLQRQQCRHSSRSC